MINAYLVVVLFVVLFKEKYISVRNKLVIIYFLTNILLGLEYYRVLGMDDATWRHTGWPALAFFVQPIIGLILLVLWVFISLKHVSWWLRISGLAFPIAGTLLGLRGATLYFW